MKRREKVSTGEINGEAKAVWAKTILSWVHAVLVFSGFYLLPAAFLRSGESVGRILSQGIFLIVPVTVSWFLAKKIRALWQYVLVSLAICVGVFFAAGFTLTMLLTALIFLLRCLVRLQKGEYSYVVDRPQIVHGVFFLLYDLWALFTGAYAQVIWIFFLLTADILVCLLYRFIVNSEAYLKEKRGEMSNVPVKTIRKVNRLLAVFLFASFVCLVLPAILYGKEPLIDLAEYLKNREYPKAVVTQVEPEQPFTEGINPGEKLLEDLGGSKEPPRWLKVLSDLVSFAVLFGGLFVAVYLLYGAWRSASRNFIREEDEVTFLEEADRKEAGRKVSAVVLRRGKDESANRRIRRIYKKTLRRRFSSVPGGAETPQELETLAGMDLEEAKELHTLYEKARYSLHGCGERDVNFLRNAKNTFKL